MKREFGKKLIEEFLASQDLTHVIDTSGAYIPGHGTPTVILVGRRRHPADADTCARCSASAASPRPRPTPRKGLVWRSIVDHLGEPGFENDFVSVTDLPRERLGRAPVVALRRRRRRADGVDSRRRSDGLATIVAEHRASPTSPARTTSSCCRERLPRSRSSSRRRRAVRRGRQVRDLASTTRRGGLSLRRTAGDSDELTRADLATPVAATRTNAGVEHVLRRDCRVERGLRWCEYAMSSLRSDIDVRCPSPSPSSPPTTTSCSTAAARSSSSRRR